MEKGWRGGEGHFGENKWLPKRWEEWVLMEIRTTFGKDKWALRRIDGRCVVSDNATWMWSWLLISQKIRVAPGVGFMTTELFWEALLLSRLGISRTQMLSAKNNSYDKVAYFRMAYLDHLHHYITSSMDETRCFLKGSSLYKRDIRRTRIVWRRTRGEDPSGNTLQC